MRRHIASLKEEFRGYNKHRAVRDLMAGLAVAAVAIPLSITGAVASGMGVNAGLLTSILGGIIIAVLSGGFYQIAGPATGATVAILLGVAANYGIEGMFMVTFLSGVIRLLVGIFKLGNFIKVLPASVVAGFASGLSMLLILGQIDNLLGVQSEGVTIIEKLVSYGKNGFHPDPTIALVGLTTLFFIIFFPKKWNAVVPATFLSLMSSAVIMFFFKIDIPVIGNIPTTLIPETRLHIASIRLSDIGGMIVPAFSIAILGTVETLLCGAMGERITGKPLDNNQELIAQGIGNMVIPFFGGMPATAAFPRTSTAVRVGATTRMGSIFNALALLAVMFFEASFLANMPLSTLAGALIIIVWRMHDWPEIQYIFSNRLKSEIIKFFVMMIATICFDLVIAISIGMVVTCISFVVKSTAVDVVMSEVDSRRINREDTPKAKEWVVVYITGTLFFMNAVRVKEKLNAIDKKKNIILSLRGVPSADVEAVEMLSEFYQEETKRGRKIILASMNLRLLRDFEQTGFLKKVEAEAVYDSVDRFLKEKL